MRSSLPIALPIALSIALSIALASGCSIKTNLLGSGKSDRSPAQSTRSASPNAASTPAVDSSDNSPSVASGNKPDYCRKERYESASLDRTRTAFEDPEERHTFELFISISRGVCNSLGEPDEHAAFLTMRQTLLNELGFKAKDVADIHVPMAMSYREGTIGYQFIRPPTPKGEQGKLATLLDAKPFYQAGLMYEASAGGRLGATLWIADALGSQLAEHTKLWLVYRLRENDLQKAIAMIDALSIDKVRLWKELSDKSIPADLRIGAMFKYAKTKRLTDARIKEFATRAKNDSGLKKLLIAIPKQTAREWASIEKKNARLIELVREAEFGLHSGKKSKRPKCGPEAKRLLTKHVKALPVPDLNANSFGLATSDVGYLVAMAGNLCSDGPLAEMSGAFGTELNDASFPRRGPRTSLVARIIASSGSFEFDETSYELGRQFSRELYGSAMSFSGNRSRGGVVRATKKRGGSAVVTFVDDVVSFPTCKKTRRTNKWRANSDGTIERVIKCVKFGASKEKQKVKPITVPANQTKGLKKGRYIEFTTAKPESAVVFAVWANSKRKKLLRLFGINR